VKLSAHPSAERGINRLMLFDAGHASEARTRHARGVMIAVSGKIIDHHIRVRQSRADHRFDICGKHRHGLLGFHQLTAGLDCIRGQRPANLLVVSVDASGGQITH
jgi:hypothetical protein